MRMTLRSLALALSFAAFATPSLAQEAKVAFGEMQQDTSLPVEVTADQFSLNNADGTATFSGNVTVVQGKMTLTANELLVKYSSDGKGIEQLIASGGVKVTNLADAAESSAAIYTVAIGVIELSGDVVLSQGQSTMRGQTLTINLMDGTGIMSGRVTTTFVPGGN